MHEQNRVSASNPLNSALPGAACTTFQPCGDHGRVEAGDPRRATDRTRRMRPQFHAAGEQDLHADDTPSTGRPAVTRSAMIFSPDTTQPRHAGLRRHRRRDHQTVGIRSSIGVGSDLDIGTGVPSARCAERRFPRPVVQDNNFHRLPLVEGTPETRGSGSTACRSAGDRLVLRLGDVVRSRPYSVRTCRAMRALNASDSNTCRLITV